MCNLQVQCTEAIALLLLWWVHAVYSRVLTLPLMQFWAWGGHGSGESGSGEGCSGASICIFVTQLPVPSKGYRKGAGPELLVAFWMHGTSQTDRTMSGDVRCLSCISGARGLARALATGRVSECFEICASTIYTLCECNLQVQRTEVVAIVCPSS